MEGIGKSTSISLLAAKAHPAVFDAGSFEVSSYAGNDNDKRTAAWSGAKSEMVLCEKKCLRMKYSVFPSL